MKCFEKLVPKQIKDNLPVSLDPHQYAFRPNRSSRDASSTALSVFTHLENKRFVYIEFNTSQVTHQADRNT